MIDTITDPVRTERKSWLENTTPTMRRLGLLFSGIAVLFLTMDGTMKVLALDVVTEATGKLGFPGTADFARELGLVLLICTALYVYPRTAMLGAILLTGYLGGAVAAHVRLGDPLFTHKLFGTYVGLFVWGGIFLRDARVRALFWFSR